MNLCGYPALGFRGYGSVTWGTVAMALGLGVPVLLVWNRSLGPLMLAPELIRERFDRVAVAPCGGVLYSSFFKKHATLYIPIHIFCIFVSRNGHRLSLQVDALISIG